MMMRLIILGSLGSAPAVPPLHGQQRTFAPADIPIDFSYAGYGGGGVAIPSIRSVLLVRPSDGDDTALLQAALDSVGRLPLQDDGFRGALQLSPGRFRVAGQLRMRASGVVLRGSPRGATTIVAAGRGRRTLLQLGGGQEPSTGTAIQVIDETVPAGSRTLRVASVEGFRAGGRVVVTRPSTKEWISALGMDTLKGNFSTLRITWTPGSRNLVWDRTIVSVDPARRELSLDAPITTSLEARFGGGTVSPVTGGPPAAHLGVENLIIESEYDASNSKDEEHAWIAVAMDEVEDAWVKDVTARHFVSSAVRVGPRARRVTVVDSRSEQPVAEVGGGRRQSFFVEGQQVLVIGCTAEGGLNDFAAGLLAAGPNVFLGDTARGALGPSGSFESWSSGVLYEKVRVAGSGLLLTYDMMRAQGAGWTAANSVIWNSSADTIAVKGRDDAPNLAVRAATPLYRTQLAARVGAARAGAALAVARAAVATTARLPEFGAGDIPPRPREGAAAHPPLRIVNGRFVVGDRTLWGGQLNEAWWRGQAVPASALDQGVSVTRFVPGRIGPGLTEDLPRLAARVAADSTPFYQMVPGLWYDRRQDAHSLEHRPDGNVWPPFYESPWARSGEGTAWDGLSKYDLTKYNPWYFARVREFAELAEQDGLAVYFNLYNNHNVLETAAHWVNFPWRPANNINDTGLPEPPLGPGASIHVSNQFFDVENPRLRELHHAYILHVLDELGEAPNLMLGAAFQFVGPLSFQQFFLDTVAEWEKRTGKRVRIVLTTTKDITDAILADPVRSRDVVAVDMRYWQYRPDGTLWAPQSGRNLAFREMIGQSFRGAGDTPPATTPEQAYRQVREYRDRFPNLAVIAWENGVGPIPALMAGGSQVIMRNPAGGHGQGRTTDRTKLDGFIQRRLATRLMTMQPRDGVASDAWTLGDPRLGTVLIYSLTGPAITLQRALPGSGYTGLWFDPRTGETRPLTALSSWGAGTTIAKPTGEDWLLLLEAR
jgi:hypothetical protein